jgi:hypothetical protein
MATVTPAKVWTSGETVTPTLLTLTGTPTVVVADNEITTSKILDGAVTNAKVATGVDASKLTTGTLPIARIADAAVTAPKLQNGVTLQTVYAQTTSLVEVTGAIPIDNTKPQSTEGNEVLTATITPSSATSKIVVQAAIVGTLGNAAGTITLSVFKGEATDAIASVWSSGGVGYAMILPIAYQDTPNSTSAVTYKIRAGYAGGTSAGLYINRSNNGAAIYGGTMTSWMTLTEIKA